MSFCHGPPHLTPADRLNLCKGRASYVSKNTHHFEIRVIWPTRRHWWCLSADAGSGPVDSSVFFSRPVCVNYIKGAVPSTFPVSPHLTDSRSCLLIRTHTTVNAESQQSEQPPLATAPSAPRPALVQGLQRRNQVL